MNKKTKPCPCGKTPQTIVPYQEANNYSLVCGDCCGEWLIEVRTDGELDKQKLDKMYRDAWNAAPRPVLPSFADVEDKSFVVEYLNQAKLLIGKLVDSEDFDIDDEIDMSNMLDALDVVIKRINKEIPKLC